MQTKPSFEVVTWNQIYDIIVSQYEEIRKDCFKPDVVVGVARGGWVPARIISDLLEVSNLVSVRVEFYSSFVEVKREPFLTQSISANVTGKKILVVDDIADTGRTLALVRDHVLEQGSTDIRILTIYSKPWSIIKPDYFGKETSFWVIFPWETKETISKIVEKYRDKVEVDIETINLVKAGLPKQLVRKFLKELLEEKNC